MVCECEKSCGDKYKDGKIYLIISLLNPERKYVGSTCQSIYYRWAQHILACGKSMTSVDKEVDADWENWKMLLYEKCSCDCKMILKRREGEITKQIGTINKRIAGTSISESNKKYNEANKEKILQINREYYHDNKEKIQQQRRIKINCDICNKLVNKNNIAPHKRSNYCKNYLNIN